MALTNLAVFGGAFFTPILVGKITHTIGWPWSFYFVTIFTGVCLPLVIFFVPETAFRRSAHLNTDMASTEDVQLFQKSVEPGQELHSSNGADPIEKSTATPEESAGKENLIPEKQPISTDHSGASTPLKAYSETLLPFSGRKADERFWKLLLRPFPLFAHPAILWACLIQGAMIGWTVFIGIILAAIFIGPPLFWDEVNTGYAYTGPFVGAICGFLIAGGLADWSAKYMTKKNNGVYEPEFRIVLVIPQLVFGCSGLYLFGVTASRLEDYKWILPVVGFGLQVGGMVIGAVAASLYIVDAHSKFNVTRHMALLMPFQGRLLLKLSLAFSSSRSVPQTQQTTIQANLLEEFLLFRTYL
jgi:MFS family permease